VHVVGGEETWQEVAPESGELIDKQTQHVWLSSPRLDPYTVHERCNRGARQRWGIETSLLVEKCQGYNYEPAFSYTWNAMKGYHYLMRLAHLVHALALATKRVASQLRTRGVQAFLRWVRESCAHRWLRREWIEHFRATPWQLRLE
jgi:hypothetical protein